MFALPDFLPGKRAFAVQLLLFHAVISAVAFQLDPRVVRVSLPAFVTDNLPVDEILEKVPVTYIIGTIHGLLSLLITVWYVPRLTQVASHHPLGQGRRPNGARQVGVSIT